MLAFLATAELSRSTLARRHGLASAHVCLPNISHSYHSGGMPCQRCWSTVVCVQLGLQRRFVVQHGHQGLDWRVLWYMGMGLIVSSHLQRSHAQRTRLEPPPAHVTTALRREHFRLAPARSHTLHRALVKIIFIMHRYSLTSCCVHWWSNRGAILRLRDGLYRVNNVQHWHSGVGRHLLA